MPAVADRVAQIVVKRAIESTLESIFLADSYGYRPNKSALDAVGVRESGAGSTTGYWSSISEVCSATLTTSSCCGPSGNM